MYDASLDQFKPHSWNNPSFWPTYSNYSRWNGNYNFSEVKSEEKENTNNLTKYLDKRYDLLIANNNSIFLSLPKLQDIRGISSLR